MPNNPKRNIKHTLQEFIDILETQEESSNGEPFHPVTIHSCRVMKSERIGEIIKEMKNYVENN